MWRSVDEKLPSPIVPMLPEVKKIQEIFRPKSAAELFCEEYDINVSDNFFTKNSDICEAFQKFGKNTGQVTFSVTYLSLINQFKKMGIPKYTNRAYRGWRCTIGDLPSHQI
jgi:hypothetical protein